MSEHRFPLSALTGDYARSLLGVALTGAPAVLLPFDAVVTSVLALLAVLFAGYGVRTIQRHRIVVLVDDDGLTVAGRRSRRPRWSAPWTGLSRVGLSFFARRRRRGEGVMELTLRFGKRRLRVDSRIDDFMSLARRAFAQAEAAELRMSSATKANFAALGLVAGSAGSGWGRPADWLKESGGR